MSVDRPFHPASEHAPEGWPRAQRPLRVAILGWARLAFQGNEGSGYNLSASELAVGLTLMGHHVFYLASGRRYDLRPSMHVAHTERWRGVECDDLVNSPNVAPASKNFTNMVAETSHQAQTSLVLRWAHDRGIELVHVHSLEGFPLELIGALRDRGIPVVVTPHNYWYACPQVDLMRGETSLCTDYDGGRQCIGCMPDQPASRTRLKRRLGQSLERVVGNGITGLGRRINYELKMRWREVRGLVPRDTPSDRDPDPEAGLGLAIEGAGAREDGLVRHMIKERRSAGVRRGVTPVDADANERFLSSDRHLVVLNDYGRRRKSGIAALNRASLVIPPSDFVRKVYVRMGLREELSRVVRLGQPHFDQIHRRVKRSPYYGATPWDARTASRPLRFAYFGAMRPSKGIDVLAAAIPMLPRDVRQRCHFFIRASGNDWPLRKPLSEYPEVSWNGGYDLLQLINSWGDYDVGILPHVWMENSPLVLLEHLHAGKFVISSRLGGPVEWVREPDNGLLVAGGRSEELVRAISRLVSGEVPIPSARAIHDATPLLRSWPDHVREVEGVYRELLGRTHAGDTPAMSSASA